MSKTLGTDVTNWQPSIDWSAARASGVRFAFCRATRGENYVDPMFEKHATDAAAEQMLTGSYHVFRTDGDPDLQALSYYTAAGSFRADLPPVIDFRSLYGDMEPAAALERALHFVIATEQLWNRGCVVRTSPAFWSLLGRSFTSELGRCPLWIAHERVEAPVIPKPWGKWLFWQFDGDGRRNLPHSVVADFHWFHGDEEMLRLYCKWRMPVLLPPDAEGEPHGADTAEPPSTVPERGARKGAA